jgi:hypothetical protein
MGLAVVMGNVLLASVSQEYHYMRLTAPTELTFYLSLVLAATSVFIEAMALTHVIKVEYAVSGYFVLLLAFLLLFAGNVSKAV